MKIFTNRFYKASFIGKILLVDIAIRELEATIGHHHDPADDEKVKKQIERIKKKAVEYGVVDKWYTDVPERWTVTPHAIKELQITKEN